jgi:hypothetical protein
MNLVTRLLNERPQPRAVGQVPDGLMQPMQKVRSSTQLLEKFLDGIKGSLSGALRHWRQLHRYHP